MSIVKNSIAALVLSSAVVAPVMAETSSWAAVSYIVDVREDSQSDLLEVEGGITMGAVGIYGFVDFDGEGTFAKINPTFALGENLYINTVVTHSAYATNVTNNYAGLGYKFSTESKGSYSVSLNARQTGTELGIDGEMNGYTIMTSFNQPLTEKLSVTGWVDVHTAMDVPTTHEDTVVEGQAGLRYDFNEVFYTRASYGFASASQKGGEGDDKMVLAVGIKF